MHHSIIVTASLLALAVAGPAQAVDVVTRNVEMGLLTAPVNLAIGSTFSGYPGPNGLQRFDRFYDNYEFTISGADVNSFAATLDLGNFFNIDNLQARLFAGTILMVPWSTPIAVGATAPSGNGVDFSVISPRTLGAGQYVLQIRGDVVGEFGGSYVGAVNLSLSRSVVAVPEPETYALFAAGLAGIGFMARSRMRA